MGPDGWISACFASHPPYGLIASVADFLNRLGKGDGLAFVCILMVLFGYLFGRRYFLKTGAGALLALIAQTPILHGLKHLIGRARPQMNLGEWQFIGPNLIKNGYDSMPSGHASASFAVASFLAFYYPRYRIAFYGIAAAIALLGRVTMRHHFLSDVICGALLGTTVGLFCAQKLKTWVEQALETKDKAILPPGDSETLPPGDLPPLQKGDRGGLESDVPMPSQTKNYTNVPAAWSLSASQSFILVFIFSSILLTMPLNRSAFWDRDETEYVQATLEMRENKEWLIPTLEGAPFIEKPIFMYWMVRASHLAFGSVNEFTSRFPSAIFAVLTCLTTFAIAHLLWGTFAGLAAGLVLATSFLFIGGFTLVMTDPYFVFFTTLSIFFYLKAWKSQKFLFLVLSYVSTGLGVLTKGPLAFFPVPVFLLFEFWREKPKVFLFLSKNFLYHCLLSLIPVAVAAPWFLYTFQKQAQATETFFLYENLSRFLKGAEGHLGPLIYYVPVLFFGLVPWSPFFVPLVLKEWSTRKEGQMQPELFFLAVWIVFLFIFFSISANKLPHYMLPVLPAFACLLGKFWQEQIFETQVSLKSAFICLTVVLCLLTGTILSLYFVRPQYASWKLWIPFVILIFVTLAAHFESTKSKMFRSFSLFTGGTLIAFFAVSLWTLPGVDEHRVMKPIGLAIKKHVSPGSNLVGFHLSEPSLFIFGGRVFPKIEDASLNDLLKAKPETFILLTESQLKKSEVNVPYAVIAEKSGFSENGGEMTLLLIKNAAPSDRSTRPRKGKS